jgi:hypothetical protein
LLSSVVVQASSGVPRLEGFAAISVIDQCVRMLELERLAYAMLLGKLHAAIRRISA